MNVWVWLRGWEDTCTATGMTREQAQRWICDMAKRRWGIDIYPAALR